MLPAENFAVCASHLLWEQLSHPPRLSPPATARHERADESDGGEAAAISTESQFPVYT